MTGLQGKTALVTGSTSGIGKITAIALADSGAHLTRSRTRELGGLANVSAGQLGTIRGLLT